MIHRRITKMLHKEFILATLVVFYVQPHLCQSNETTNVTTSNSIPFSTRAYWMRAANKALSDLDSPCPLYAFATVIVNHTANGLGELVCVGINRVSTGNPTMHGEMVAIGNCSTILTAKTGSPAKALRAFSQLSLYTNGEGCPMVSESRIVLQRLSLIYDIYDNLVRFCHSMGSF